MVEVFLIHRYQLLSEAIVGSLNSNGRVRCVGTAEGHGPAMERLQSLEVDVVVVDASLGHREVCETIRANPDWQGVRVVMLTAKGREVEREKGLALGADDYLTKPFSTDEVVAKVQALLAGGP